MKRLTLWSLIGSIWTAWWAFVMIWITIYDLPPGSTYWSWCIDTTGYWHEMALPLMSWLSGLFMLMLVSAWYHLVQFLTTVRAVWFMPDGRILFVRKKRVVKRRESSTSGNLIDEGDTS